MSREVEAGNLGETRCTVFNFGMALRQSQVSDWKLDEDGLLGPSQEDCSSVNVGHPQSLHPAFHRRRLFTTSSVDICPLQTQKVDMWCTDLWQVSRIRRFLPTGNFTGENLTRRSNFDLKMLAMFLLRHVFVRHDKLHWNMQKVTPRSFLYKHSNLNLILYLMFPFQAAFTSG